MFLRVSEAAELLSCSERTVRRWIATGALNSVKIGGARRVPQTEISRLLEAVPDGYWEHADTKQ